MRKMNGEYDGVPPTAGLLKWVVNMCLVVATVLHTSVALANELPDELQEAIAQTGLPQEAVGMVVEPLDGSGLVVSLNADKPFHTASTMKVVTTYAALELLGPSKVWKTVF